MTNPHNVDICITCVSDKPPQLPLREELPSLGIELIYNARGTGAKASKRESQKLLKKFREKEQVKDPKNRRFFPSNPFKAKEKKEEQKRRECELGVPKALSYESYKECLDQNIGKETESSSYESTWDASSTLESLIENNREKNKTQVQLHPSLSLRPTHEVPTQPPTIVEFPTHSPEELALNEAFKVFSSPSARDPHLDVAETRESTKKASLGFVSSANANVTENVKTNVLSPSSSAQVTEFYDLTEVSDDDAKVVFYSESMSKDLSTLSSKRENQAFNSSGYVEVYPNSATQQQLPGISLQVSELDDGFGHIVLDLSSVLEEDSSHLLATTVKKEKCASKIDGTVLGQEKRLDCISALESPTSLRASNRVGPYATESLHKNMKSLIDDTSTCGVSMSLSPQKSNAENSTGDAYDKEIVIHSSRKTKHQDSDNFGEHAVTFGRSGVDVRDFKSESPEIGLLNALSYGYPLPRDFKEILTRSPYLAKAKLPQSGVYPLHAACARIFPDRFSENVTCSVEDLVMDVIEKKNLISAVVRAHPDVCKCLDGNRDLPVHILARQLMEWEALWYQQVYEKAQDEGDDETGNESYITKLYQTMSQCIDILLRPIADESWLCEQQGSIGRLLPLHIASIFTVSYDTLKMLLEIHPNAATLKCDLKNIRTFIPTDSLPLELHDRLSTDFPKWEIDSIASDEVDEVEWTQSAIDEAYGTKGAMRRSDLLFAFNPWIMPYRQDFQRIRRIETRIQKEASDAAGDEGNEISPSAQLSWTWMCTYESADDEGDNYAESVKRIIQSLSFKSVKYLAALPLAANGKPVVDQAIPACSETIRARMEEIAKTEIPVPTQLRTTGFASKERSILLREWEEDLAARFCLRGRGFVATLCRTLFNISETSFPTSFVFLPYKLVKNEEGQLCLESAEAASVAMKFADCLLHITEAKRILHFLEGKAVRSLGTNLCRRDGIQNDHETKEYVDQLLRLFDGRPAYFYFLDEFTGVPIVPESNSVYPLIVNESVDTVRKLLPLMLTGMIIMRGEKALPVIAEVLLSKNLEVVQSRWVETARDLVGYVYSPQSEKAKREGLLPLREELVDFIERGVSEDSSHFERSHNGLASEWVVELSLVKMVVEMHDSSHTHAGLKPRRAGSNVLWTCENEFLDAQCSSHLFQMDYKSIVDLKGFSSQKAKNMLEVSRRREQNYQLNFDANRKVTLESVENENASRSGYELLFRELALGNPPTGSDGSDGDYDGASEEPCQPWPRDQDIEHGALPLSTPRANHASSAEPDSLISFDDDLDLDDELQLRILLDEQEAKLEFLREKMEEIEDTEVEVLEQEEKIGDILDDVNNQKDNLLNSPSSKGLASARKLLLRICDLEDRVLCREIEVGQLKNDITVFELEAKHDNEDIVLPNDFE